MRAKHLLLQLASLGALSGLLFSPALAGGPDSYWGVSPKAAPKAAGQALGTAGSAIGGTVGQGLGAAGKAVGGTANQTTGGMTQSPVAKAPQTPMAKAEPAYEDNAPYAADEFSQPAGQPAANLNQSPAGTMKSDHMAKAAPAYDDIDSPPAASAGASNEFSQPAGEAANPPKAMLERSPAWGVKSDHMAKAEPTFEDVHPTPPATAGANDLPALAAGGMPAASGPASRSATGQALGTAQPQLGATIGDAPSD